jgi:hypothetical protein
MCKSRTSFNNNRIAQRRLRPCNLHSPLSLRINAIVDDHIAVAVALVFAKLSIAGATGGATGCPFFARTAPRNLCIIHRNWNLELFLSNV